MLEVIVRLLTSLIAPSKETKGAIYEKMVRGVLTIGCDFQVLYRNLLVPDGDGTTECDLLLLGRKGLYVIECKNYAGKIYGRDASRWWTQYLNGKGFKFYNPMMQNKGHCDALSSCLKEPSLPIFSIVVFADKADISKVVIESGEYSSQLCTTMTLLPTIKKLAKESTIEIPDDVLSKVQTALDGLQISSEGRKDEHVSHVKEKFNAKVCPLCDGQLVKRKGKTWFWGCSNYPKCRYSRPINSGDR